MSSVRLPWGRGKIVGLGEMGVAKFWKGGIISGS